MSESPLPPGMAEAAANPATDPETLREIAYHFPTLRPVVAENPNAYDGLVEWLGAFGDPATDAAIARRNAGVAAPGLGAQPQPQAEAQPEPQPEPQAQVEPQPEPEPVADAQGAEAATTAMPVEQNPYGTPDGSSTPEQAAPQAAIPAAGAYPTGQIPQQPVGQQGFPTEQAYPQQGYQTSQPYTQQGYQPQQPDPAAAAAPTPAPDAKGGNGMKVALGVLSVLALALCTVAVLLFTGVIGSKDDPVPTAQPTATASPSPSASANAAQSTAADKAQSTAAEKEAAKAKEEAAAKKFPAPTNARKGNSFTAPSGNITCTLTDNVVHCTIFENDFAAKGYQSCSNASAFTVDGSTAKLDCGAVRESTGAVLNYGEVMASGDVACMSASEGITCWNQKTGASIGLARHGWVTGKAGQMTTRELETMGR